MRAPPHLVLRVNRTLAVTEGAVDTVEVEGPQIPQLPSSYSSSHLQVLDSLGDSLDQSPRVRFLLQGETPSTLEGLEQIRVSHIQNRIRAGSVARAAHPGISEQGGHRTCDRPTDSRLLLTYVSGPQEERQGPTHHQPQAAQSLSGLSGWCMQLYRWETGLPLLI